MEKTLTELILEQRSYLKNTFPKGALGQLVVEGEDHPEIMTKKLSDEAYKGTGAAAGAASGASGASAPAASTPAAPASSASGSSNPYGGEEGH